MQTAVLHPTNLAGEGVYFLKSRTPYVAQTGKRQKSFQYYVGWSKNVAARIKSHRQGKGPGQGGSRITQVWFQNGIEFDVILFMPGGTRTDERHIKNGGHYDRIVRRAMQIEAHADEWEAAYRAA